MATDALSTEKHVLITGASGFIGRALCAAFGDQAIGLVGPHSKPSDTRFACDLSDLEEVKKLAEKLKGYTITHILHVAAVTPWSQNPDFSLDIKMAESVAWLCHELSIPDAVFISGWNVYDMQGAVPFSEQTPIIKPVGEYGESKYAVESFLTQHLENTHLTILRTASIYGPGQLSSGLIPNLVASALETGGMKISSPHIKRDYLYVDDFVQTLRTLVDDENTAPVRILNIGSGRSESVGSVAEIIRQIIGMDTEIIIEESSAENTLQDNQLDITAAQTKGLLTHTTSLSKGLAKYIEWRTT